MEKNKGKKKSSKSGSKTTKKKTGGKKTDKASKKKKTTKKDEIEEEQPENEEVEKIEVIEQKEEGDDINNIKEKLNKPLNKKKLPPIEKNNELQPGENEEEKEIKEGEMNKEEINKEEEKKEPIEKIDSSVGTPFFYDIGRLKSEVESQNKKINMENLAQEKYKISLNNLLNDLNKVLSENVEYLYDEGEDDIKKQKMEHIHNLQNILLAHQHQIKEVKEKNKLYKQHYEILMKQDETRIIQSAKEYEALIEEKKNDNNNLNKKISELKQSSQIGRKKLEAYSENVKYPQDINNLANQLKTLLKKKADYFSKLNKEIKTLNICKKELETLEKFYDKKKKEKNFTNPKIEEDMRRLKEDLTGNESEIYNKVQNDQAFIVRKQIHQEKVNNIFKTPVINKPQDAKKMKLKKGNSLEPLTMKAIRYDVRSGYNSRRMNIVAKNKSPGQNTYEKNSTNSNSNNVLKKENNNILEEEDLSNINYNTFTDFEYRELLTKKEHCYDVTQRLEKSIKEAVKMYTRKIKEIKITLSENSKKLLERKEENTKLESEIEDLKRILSLTEEEAKLNNMNNINNNKLPEKIKNKNDINEKELDSQKEYLSPEYYNSNKNKKSMEKKVLSNNDLTGNDLLNDLKGLNVDQTGPLISGQEGQKMNNINMKFPDLSNIEDDKNEKNIIINNEFDRSKAIDDIKKKYNIKKTNIEENNDIDIDENELNFGEKMQNKKNENDNDNENIEDINDENKFFKENENILKNDEIGQYEPPIDNEIEVDNNNNNNNVNIEEKKIEEDNNNNINTNNINKEENNINKEEININNNENNENLIEPEKKEEDKVNIKKEEEKEEEKEKEDLNENKEKENEKEDLNEVNNENNNDINNENNNNEDNNSRFGNYINREISNNERSGLMVVEQKENRGIIETDINNEIINNKEIEQDNNEQNENKEIKDDNNINNNEIEQKEENKEMKENIEVNNDENKVEKEEKIEIENNLDNQEENQNQNKQEDENINMNEIENQDNKENNEEQQNLENQKEIENINDNNENNENNNLEEEKKEEINEIENNAEEKKEEEKKEETEIKNEEVEEQKENNELEENKEVQEQEDKKEINEAELENNNEEKKDEKIEGETEEKKEEKIEEKSYENKEENKKADDELDMDDLQI